MSVSQYVIPVLMLLVILLAMLRKVNVYDVFVDGAKDGLKMLMKILPYLVAVMVMVEMIKASGMIGWVEQGMKPLLRGMGLPAGVAPLVVLRPFSGAAALGILSEIFRTHGVDSATARVAAVLMGSTETLFYTLAIYCGAGGIRKTRYIVPVSLLAMLCGMVVAGLMWH